MEKEFVPYELAVKLKQIGFNEPCLTCYDKLEMIASHGKHVFDYKNYNTSGYMVSRPTFSQAFRWFREKYNLYHTIDKQGYWFFQIKKDEGFGDLTEVIVTYDYNSYEEAELACLDKLIEVVEQIEKVEHGVYR